MKTQVRILAQLHENKAWYEGGEAWKPKGGVEFSVNVDDGIAMYAEESMILAFMQLLEQESNNCERFTYVSHELIFSKIHELSDEDFKNAYENNFIIS